MAATTLPALLDVGDHSSRPAASAVGSGGLYSCTDHNLIYQTDGSSWSTWATLGGSGDVATDTIWDAAGDLAVGSGSNTAARLAAGSEDDVLTIVSGVPAWAAPAGGGGSTGARYPVQEKIYGSANTNSRGVTLGATPTNGNHLILCSAVEGAHNISSITQTNVTWSKLAESTASTAPHAELWIGVVSASAGTGITVAYSGSSYGGYVVSEWSGLAGTLDQSATATNTAVMYLPTITPTAATALVIVAGSQSTYTSDFAATAGPGLLRFKTGDANNNYSAAFGFLGTSPVIGYAANTHGGTFSCVTASIT